MPRFTSALAATALAAGAVVATATSAQAAPVGDCKEVSRDGISVVIACAFADLRESTTSGVTVAPYVVVGCSIASKPTCSLLFPNYALVDIGTTGFVPNPSFTPPLVDVSSGTVKVYAGTVGSVWIDGTEYPITVDEFCVGDPTIC